MWGKVRIVWRVVGVIRELVRCFCVDVSSTFYKLVSCLELSWSKKKDILEKGTNVDRTITNSQMRMPFDFASSR